MDRVAWLAALLLLGGSVASAQTGAPEHLPVIFESDDARDLAYEAVTQRLIQLHLEERVPLVQATVPCGAGSSLPPRYECVRGRLHEIYADLTHAHPDLLEIGQHGLTHEEMLAALPFETQLDYIGRGLEEMRSWGLPGGRPFSFAAPFGSSNASTIRALETLGFHVSVRNSGGCNPSDVLDVFCNSVPICELDRSGGRVAGPSCVLRDPRELIAAVNARRGEGKVFLVYHVQDLTTDRVTVDEAKMERFRELLRAFRAEAQAGRYDLMTLESHWRRIHGLPPLGGPPRPPAIVTGADAGATPHVVLWRTTGDTVSAQASFFPYDRAFGGGARVAACGRSLLATAPGPGGGPNVRIWDVSGALPAPRSGFFAYSRQFTGGVYVAMGRGDADGTPIVVTGAGETGGPHVRVFELADPTRPVPIDRGGFLPFPSLSAGGARVAACDLDGDGADEVIAAAGPGGPPIVRAVHRDAGGTFSDMGSFLAYDPAFRGGVWVACGDVDGDGRSEVVTGAGAGGGPHVRVFDRRDGEFVDAGGFFPFARAFTGGVRVAVGDTGNDGRSNIIAAAGPGGGPQVRVFRIGASGVPAAIAPSYLAYGAFSGGVFVGGFAAH